jgi:serine protease AprX
MFRVSSMLRYLPIWLVLHLCMLPILNVAQAGTTLLSQKPASYWVVFTDKEGNNHDLSLPHAFLSSRALTRRHVQGIAITEADLPVSQTYIETLLSFENVQLSYVSRWFNGALLQISEPSAVSFIEALPFVHSVEMVKPHLDEKRFARADKLDIALPDARETDAFTQITQLNGQYLHEQGFGGEGKMIAVLDAGFTGVDRLGAFNSLREQGRLTAYRDFADRDGDIFDIHMHGTYVLSVMTGDIPGMLAGSAPAASYLLLRTEDVASEYRIEEYNWLAAAEYADSIGADIINSSLGYTLFEDAEQSYTYEDMDGQSSVVARAARMAAERGMLVVVSAGNYGDKPWQFIGTPADAFQVISVGAIDASGQRVAFSSVGPSADGRMKPEVVAMGRGVVVSDMNDGTRTANGTSFSAPLIAGLAACLWEKYPSLTAGQLRTALMESGHRAFNPDNLTGYGIPDLKIADRRLQSLVSGREDVMLYPNPFFMQANISIYSHVEGQTIQLSVYNIMGQLIHSKNHVSLSKGHNTIPLQHAVAGLKPGLYHFTIHSEDFFYSIKGLKMQ